MDNKEGASPQPANTSLVPQPKDPSLPQPIPNAKPNFIIEAMAKRQGTSFEEAEKKFDEMPDPKSRGEEPPQLPLTPTISPRNEGISRRDFLKKAAVGGAIVTVGGGLAATEIEKLATGKPSLFRDAWNWFKRRKENNIQEAQQENQPDVASTLIDIEPKVNFAKINEINKKKPGTTERTDLELSYVEEAQTLEQLEMGLYVINDPVIRAAVWEKMGTLREEHKDNLREATHVEKEFARKHHLDLEFVVRCHASYYESKSMLTNSMNQLGREEFFNKFKPGLVAKVKSGEIPKEVLDHLNVEDILPNAGVLIGLILNETGKQFNEDGYKLPKGVILRKGVWYGGVNVGNKIALKAIDSLDSINPKLWTREKKDQTKIHLENLAAILSLEKENGGIPIKYNAQTMGGSYTGDLGIAQFFPETALRLFNTLRDYFDFYFHPGSLKAITAAYIFLGMDARANDKGEFQFGYISIPEAKLNKIPTLGGQVKGILEKLKEIRNYSFRKWNPELVEKMQIWENIYQTEVIDKGKKTEIDQAYAVTG